MRNFVARKFSNLRHSSCLIKPLDTEEVHAAIYSNLSHANNFWMFLRSAEGPIELIERYHYKDFSSAEISKEISSTKFHPLKGKDQKWQNVTSKFSSEELEEFIGFLRKDIVTNLGKSSVGFYNLCLSDKPYGSQNRSLGFKYFPLLGEIALLGTPESEALISSLDQGARLENLKKYFNAPWASDGFLRRMSSQFTPSLDDVCYLGEALSSGLVVKSDGKFDEESQKKFNVRVTKIPLHDNSQIEEMWNVIKFIRGNRLCRKEMAYNLIVKIGDKWQQNSKLIDKNPLKEKWHEYFSELTEDIILPEVLSRVEKLYLEEDKEIPIQALEHKSLNHHNEISDLFWKLQESMASHLTLISLEDKAEKLRKSGKAIFSKRSILIAEEQENKKQGLKARSLRYPLFPEVEVEMDGYKIRSLVNKEELVDVGEKLGNCLTDDIRARTVRSGEFHFISITAPDNTLYAALIGRDLQFRDGPHSGKIDRIDIPAPPKVKSEILQCLKKLRNTIGLNPNQGLVDNEFTRSLKSKIGFDPLDSVERKEIFDEYLTQKIFPNSIKCDSVQGFIEILGMDEIITKAAVSYKLSLDKKLQPSFVIENPILLENFEEKGRFL